MSKSRQAIEGVKWNYISTIGLAIAQLSFAAVFARLLDPMAFGLMAMANLMIKFGSYFSGSGIRTHLIRERNVDDVDVETSFWVSSMFGVAIAALAVLLAPMVGQIFRSDAVEPVVRLLSLSYILTGLSIASSAMMHRALRFKEISIAEFSCYCAGYLGVGIPLAVMGFGVYALVFSMLANQFLLMVSYYMLCPHKVAFSFHAGRFRRVLGSGTHYSFNSILDFALNSMPTFLIGRSFGELLLGVFNRANMLVTLPTNNVSAAVSRVFFPLIASMQNDPDRLKELYIKGSTLITLIMFPLSIGMIPAASELVLVVLGDKWAAGIPVFQVLAVAMMFHFASIFPGQYADAHGYLKTRTAIQVATISITLIFIFLFIDRGLVGVAVGFSLGQIFRFIIFNIFLRIWIKLELADYIAIYAPGLVVGVVSAIGVWLVHLYFQWGPLIVTLIMEMLVGATMYCVLLAFLPFKRMRVTLLHMLTLYCGDNEQASSGKVIEFFKVRFSR